MAEWSPSAAIIRQQLPGPARSLCARSHWPSLPLRCVRIAVSISLSMSISAPFNLRHAAAPTYTSAAARRSCHQSPRDIPALRKTPRCHGSPAQISPQFEPRFVPYTLSLHNTATPTIYLSTSSPFSTGVHVRSNTSTDAPPRHWLPTTLRRRRHIFCRSSVACHSHARSLGDPYMFTLASSSDLASPPTPLTATVPAPPRQRCTIRNAASRAPPSSPDSWHKTPRRLIQHPSSCGLGQHYLCLRLQRPGRGPIRHLRITSPRQHYPPQPPTLINQPDRVSVVQSQHTQLLALTPSLLSGGNQARQPPVAAPAPPFDAPATMTCKSPMPLVLPAFPSQLPSRLMFVTVSITPLACGAFASHLPPATPRSVPPRASPLSATISRSAAVLMQQSPEWHHTRHPPAQSPQRNHTWRAVHTRPTRLLVPTLPARNTALSPLRPPQPPHTSGWASPALSQRYVIRRFFHLRRKLAPPLRLVLRPPQLRARCVPIRNPQAKVRVRNAIVHFSISLGWGHTQAVLKECPIVLTIAN